MIEPLFSRIARNEPDALRECISRYEGLVWTLARRFCRNHADAEDAVQRIFLELWRSAARYNPTIAPEATFVSVIARREMIDWLRQSLRRRATVPIEDQHAASSPESPLERHEEAHRASRSILRLGANERLVISLSIDRGLSHRCIAQVTGLPVGTVKTHVRRGLRKLRGMLSPEAHGREMAPGRDRCSDPRSAFLLVK